jgi:hypothetical protein
MRQVSGFRQDLEMPNLCQDKEDGENRDGLPVESKIIGRAAALQLPGLIR